MKLRYYTWEEFDDAVARTPRPVARSLFAIPRGGLIYATALSHKFDLPLTDKPDKFSILVDDIADSGKTLTAMRFKYGTLPAYVLIQRHNCFGRMITAANIEATDDWIVFPWENEEKVERDYANYLSRK